MISPSVFAASSCRGDTPSTDRRAWAPTKRITANSREASRCFFFFKQKTAYEILRSDWGSDVCSSDLGAWRTRIPQGPRRTVATSTLPAPGRLRRSEERRVGKECVSTCRSRWSPPHSKKNAKPLKIDNTGAQHSSTTHIATDL